MTPQLRLIDSASYAREVLPVTAPLWAAGRDLDTYVRHTLELAASGYGRRHYSTIGLYDGNVLSASCKRYEREIRVGERTLKAMGIGAVFTPPELRGRGYASAMLATLMDREHAAGLDALFLFSDIEPAFYETLGFLAFPSRVFSLRADDLPHARMTIKQATPEDLAGVRRSFARHERMRPWSFKRTPLFWEWLYLRTRHGSEHPNGDALTFVLREGSRVDAYVTGVRSPAHDSFIVDELGLRDERDRDLIAPFLRSAAGDLRRIVGWLPPEPIRKLLPRGSIRRRKDAIFMLAPISKAAHVWARAAAIGGIGDSVWSTDHI